MALHHYKNTKIRCKNIDYSLKKSYTLLIDFDDYIVFFIQKPTQMTYSYKLFIYKLFNYKLFIALLNSGRVLSTLSY